MNDQNDAIVLQLRVFVVLVRVSTPFVHALFFFCLVFLFLYYYCLENRRGYTVLVLLFYSGIRKEGVVVLFLLMLLLFCDSFIYRLHTGEIILLFLVLLPALYKCRLG